MEGIPVFTSSAAVASAAGTLAPLPGSAGDDPVVALADEFLGWLATTSGAGVDDTVRINRISALERVKGALAAAQVRQTVAFAASQRAGMPPWTPERTAVRSIGSQIGLARGESPTRGDAHVALAHALTQSMPQTLAALTAGQISEAAAEGIHRAVDGVDPAVRGEVDARLAPELGQLGERSLAEAARRVVADVDEEAATRRVEGAARERRVTLRTAPDGMAYLTLLAPMAEAAGAFQAVEAEATAILGQPTCSGSPSRRSAFWLAEPTERSSAAAGAGSGTEGVAMPVGSPALPGASAAVPDDHASQSGRSFFRSGEVRRTRSQMMADVVISRLTGRAIGQPVPIEIQLVMTDAALHEDADTNGQDTDVREQAADVEPSRNGHESDDIPRRGDRARETRRQTHEEHAHRQRGSESSGHPAFPRTPTPTGGPAKAGTGPYTGAYSAPDGSASPGAPCPTIPGPRPPNSPAKIVGAGWLPAGFARELVRRTVAAGSEVTVRRVAPGADGGTVVGLEARRHRLSEPRGRPEPIPVLAPTGSRQRLFRGVLRRLVMVRDQACRTPFCAAAIRAVDHVTPARRDGPTCLHNAAGTCDRCNLTKEAPGWKVVVLTPPPMLRCDPDDPPWKQLMDELLIADAHQTAPSDDTHRTAVVTPTGHRYESVAPPVTERRRSRSEAG